MYNQGPLEQDAEDNHSAWKSIGNFSPIKTGDKVSGTTYGKEKPTDLMETKQDSDYYYIQSN